MADMLKLIQDAKVFADSALLDESDLTSEKDENLTMAVWAKFINMSKDYHYNIFKNAAQDYFAVKGTISFTSGTQEYSTPGNSVEIRYLEKTDCDPDEVIHPINIDQRLDYVDDENNTDDDDTVTHHAYIFNRIIGFQPNMDTATNGINIFYIRRLPDMLYGTCTATGTTLVLPATPTFGVTSTEDDKYNDARVKVISATTGAGQIKEVADYVGSTRTCTVSTWGTTPTGTIVAEIMCDIPEEHHWAVSLYAAILARTSDHEKIGDLALLYKDASDQIKEGLSRSRQKGVLVENNDL